jgi:hypothetical protein
MGDGNLQDCRLHPLYPISHKAPTITTHGCIPLCSAPASPWDPVQSQWLQPTNSCRAACPGQHPLRLTTQCSATALLNVCHCCHSVVPDCTAVKQQHWQLPLTRAKASSVVHKAGANILFPLCIFIQPFSFHGPYLNPGPEFWTGWGLCRHDLTPFDPTATGVTLIVLLVVLPSALLSCRQHICHQLWEPYQNSSCSNKLNCSLA